MAKLGAGAAAAGSSVAGANSIFDLTFIVFLVLKLTGTIDWSWWWVTAPIWIPFAFFIFVAIVIGIIYACVK